MWDVIRFNGQTQFNMCAMLMWTMHDLPTYGTLVGFATKGYQRYQCCGAKTMTRRSWALGNNVHCWTQHRKWLPMEHAYCHKTLSFDGVHEEGMTLQWMIVEEIYRVTTTQTTWLTSGGRPYCNNPTKTYGLKKLNRLFQSRNIGR
jgi:hypothetical protein